MRVKVMAVVMLTAPANFSMRDPASCPLVSPTEGMWLEVEMTSPRAGLKAGASVS